MPKAKQKLRRRRAPQEPRSSAETKGGTGNGPETVTPRWSQPPNKSSATRNRWLADPIDLESPTPGHHANTEMAAASPAPFLSRLWPCVAMVEATQAWQRSQTGIRRWLSLDRASIGRVFAQRVVNAILMVIAHVVADQTAKVFFIHRDDMVEDLAAAASDPSFGGSVLPRRLNARPFGLKSGGLQEGNNISIEDRIVIQNGVAIRSRLRKGFAQLLHDPIGRRMPRHIEVQDLAAPVVLRKNKGRR